MKVNPTFRILYDAIVTRRYAHRFDPKCYELANVFLRGNPKLHSIDSINELAQRIQHTIEEFLEEKEPEVKAR